MPKPGAGPWRTRSAWVPGDRGRNPHTVFRKGGTKPRLAASAATTEPSPPLASSPGSPGPGGAFTALPPDRGQSLWSKGSAKASEPVTVTRKVDYMMSLGTWGVSATPATRNWGRYPHCKLGVIGRMETARQQKENTRQRKRGQDGAPIVVLRRLGRRRLSFWFRVCSPWQSRRQHWCLPRAAGGQGGASVPSTGDSIKQSHRAVKMQGAFITSEPHPLGGRAGGRSHRVK